MVEIARAVREPDRNRRVADLEQHTTRTTRATGRWFSHAQFRREPRRNMNINLTGIILFHLN
jgi:hypothetical protein